MNTCLFHVFDPLAGEWAAPYPAVFPMTKNASQAALFPSIHSATTIALHLVDAGFEQLQVLPVRRCPDCGGWAVCDLEGMGPETGPVSGIVADDPEGLHYSWYKGEVPGLPHLA